MARRGHEFQAETLDVVDRIADGVDFELAAVARSRIDLADGQRAAEPLAGALAQRLGCFLERSSVRTRPRDRGRALAQGVEQERSHRPGLTDRGLNRSN